MFGYLPDFVHAHSRAGLRLVAHIEPRLDAGQDRLEPIALEPFQVRLRKQGQAAFGDEVDAARRHGFFDHVQIFVKADAEIGIVPGDHGSLELRQQEPQVLAEHVEIHRLVGHGGIDAKAACVRTPQAAEHGNHLEEGRFPERRFDELPALAYTRERSRLLGGREADAAGRCWEQSARMARSVSLIREAQNVIEVTGRRLPGSTGRAAPR